MDYQGIGMFIYVLVTRSKASNTNASLVPEIEMKEA